ncbi:MAG TPA: tRNA lysidine(34) synthetase TilS [Methylomirabilota bacterium]|nr:tRNA lysidine(34) synthetase TilS [Methylomirabilota bacterium]
MTDLLQRVKNSIQSRLLISIGEKILVAVSGGLDSIVLLHALEKISRKYRWKITVAHFNHRLRGRASDADEKLVCKIAAKLKLPIIVESADVKSFAKKSKLSIEMAARKLRHESLARVARTRKIKTVALAHHADDQVELFFLRLLRGAGGEGLGGMKWKSPSPAEKTVSLARPLLDFSKSELQEFADENKIQFRHDATNYSSDFLRNRIRNGLLPLLRKNYQPALDKAVLRLMEIVGAESEFVGEVAKQKFKNLKHTPHPGPLPVLRGEGEKKEAARKHSFAPPKRGEGGRRPDEGIFNDLPIAIQRRVLQSQLAKFCVADFDLIEQLRGSAGKFVSVGSGLSVARDANGKLKLREQQLSEFNANELEVNLSGRAGEAVFGGIFFVWKLIGSRGRSPHRPQTEFFDADKIGGKIILRHWRTGDRFQPIGLKSPAKLQDLFTNAKIPREQRRKLILATTSVGEVFWVEGLRISENSKITPKTKRQLIWRWQNRH